MSLVFVAVATILNLGFWLGLLWLGAALGFLVIGSYGEIRAPELVAILVLSSAIPVSGFTAGCIVEKFCFAEARIKVLSQFIALLCAVIILGSAKSMDYLEFILGAVHGKNSMIILGAMLAFSGKMVFVAGVAAGACVLFALLFEVLTVWLGESMGFAHAYRSTGIRPLLVLLSVSLGAGLISDLFVAELTKL